jgi:cell filamentation protein
VEEPSWRYREYEPDEAEPGSDGRVLKNKLKIVDPEEIEDIEEMLLQRTYEALLTSGAEERPVTCEDMRTWHRQFLGELYEWAGEYRTAEISLPRDDFGFCRSKHIHSCMEHYERKLLANLTPLSRGEPEAHFGALAELHAEFIIIHPFRDGNGRVGRFMVDWLLCAVGALVLNWNLMGDREILSYREGIRTAAVSRDYEPLAAFFLSLKSS